MLDAAMLRCQEEAARARERQLLLEDGERGVADRVQRRDELRVHRDPRVVGRGHLLGQLADERVAQLAEQRHQLLARRGALAAEHVPLEGVDDHALEDGLAHRARHLLQPLRVPDRAGHRRHDHHHLLVLLAADGRERARELLVPPRSVRPAALVHDVHLRRRRRLLAADDPAQHTFHGVEQEAEPQPELAVGVLREEHAADEEAQQRRQDAEEADPAERYAGCRTEVAHPGSENLSSITLETPAFLHEQVDLEVQVGGVVLVDVGAAGGSERGGAGSEEQHGAAARHSCRVFCRIYFWVGSWRWRSGTDEDTGLPSSKILDALRRSTRRPGVGLMRPDKVTHGQ